MLRISLTQLRYKLRCQFHSYRHYRRSRRQLLALDDRLLEDIGFTREQAQQEGHKPFWKHSLHNGDVYEEH
ncbi:MAG: DUF1127 domain-containing protein [Halomonas sp.]|uniref:DUF1127 domain-containing protein n=1 Tax=unclassified Halomonas TaxID=2609666 RepID=UPI003FDA36A0